MNDKDIIIKNYLYNEKNKDTEDMHIIIKLYLLCKKMDRLLSLNKNYNLKKIEDKIYCVNNESLTDIEKIKLELFRCEEENNVKIKKRLNSAIEYLLNKKYLTDDDISYLKQEIVKMQILSNQNITFFEEAYKLFDNYLNMIDFKVKVK